MKQAAQLSVRTWRIVLLNVSRVTGEDVTTDVRTEEAFLNSQPQKM